jgi:hypothetical protein
MLARDEPGQLVLIDVPELDETVAEPHSALRLLLERTRELLFVDEPFSDECFAETVRSRYRSCHVRRVAKCVGVETRSEISIGMDPRFT